MAQKDLRIDAYIKNSAEFAQPILEHFRELLHEVCPEVEETIKWGCPHFTYMGAIMCSMASFKQHCAISFRKAALMSDKTLHAKAKSEEAMGHFGRLTTLKDLPKDSAMKRYIKEAMQLNEDHASLPKLKMASVKELVVPDYINAALAKNKTAQKKFLAYSYSHKKEYVTWITEAKTEATRQKRISTMIEWLLEGKHRHWQYRK